MIMAAVPRALPAVPLAWASDCVQHCCAVLWPDSWATPAAAAVVVAKAVGQLDIHWVSL